MYTLNSIKIYKQNKEETKILILKTHPASSVRLVNFDTEQKTFILSKKAYEIQLVFSFDKVIVGINWFWKTKIFTNLKT